MEEKKIPLIVAGISYSEMQTGMYILVLQEENGTKRLPIVIGGFEAQAIAIELENMKPSRPLTHDLFKTMMDEFGITLKEVIIEKMEEGIFYATMVCENKEKSVRLDSRTSDAVAMAVRFKCPIYTYQEVLDKVGVEPPDLTDEDTDEKKIEELELTEEEGPKTKAIEEMDLDELKERLQKAIEEENYELASIIRDEIKRRKSSS